MAIEKKNQNKIWYYDHEVDAVKDLTIGLYVFHDLIEHDEDDFEDKKAWMRDFLKKTFGDCKIFNSEQKGISSFYVPAKSIK